MQPFFSSTRASMISCPTTNCRCSSGFRSSSGIELQGVYCNAAGLAACLVTARLAREWDLVADLAREADFDFVFAIGFCSGDAVWCRPSRDSFPLLLYPGTSVPGFHISPLRGLGNHA